MTSPGRVARSVRRRARRVTPPTGDALSTTIGLLVNPHSARALARAAAFVRLAERAGHLVIRAGGGTAATASAAAAVLVRSGIDVLVAVGGDGTVHLAVNALASLAADSDAGDTQPALVILPAGSGNDLARQLGMSADPVRSLDLVTHGRPRRIDLVRWTSAGGAGGAGGWYAGVLAAGFDARVNARANRSRRSRWSYPAAVLTELADLHARRYRFTLDPAGPAPSVIEQPAVLLAVAGGTSYGGGMHIAPQARLDDGLLDIALVDEVSRGELLRVFPRVFRGTHIHHPAVHIHRAGSVRIELVDDGPEVVAFGDGERLGPLPLVCAVAPSALTVLG